MIFFISVSLESFRLVVYLYVCLFIYLFINRRQRGSVVRVGALNVEEPGSDPLLGLLNEFVLGVPGANLQCFVNSQLVCPLPVGIRNWKRGGF